MAAMTPPARDPVDIVEAPRPEDVPDTAAALLASLRGPTVFHRAGRDRGRTRVVTALLHGNEPSGLYAVHEALRGPPPATDVLFFVGAVEAARAGRRMLPGRRDLNRCFRPPYDDDDGRIAEQATRILRAAHPEAVIDLHNNSGHNPAYGLGSHLDGARLWLCALFANRYVQTGLRLGTVLEALEDLAPAVTIECGRAGDPAADSPAIAGLGRFLGAERIESVLVGPNPMAVLVDPVRVRLRPGLTVAFAARPDPAAALTLDPEIDRHNFQVLAPGTRLGWVRPDVPWPLCADDAAGSEVSRAHFQVEAGSLVTSHSFVPIMMTTDPTAAASDCLFYLARERS